MLSYLKESVIVHILKTGEKGLQPLQGTVLNMVNSEEAVSQLPIASGLFGMQ